MKNVNKKLMVMAVAGVLGMGSVSAMAADGLSANVSLVSNYLWRGVVQADKENQMTVQGGFDYTSGPVSFGTWGSSLYGAGTEQDFYGSYAAGPVTVGAIYYYYGTPSDFYEVNVGGDVGPVSLMASYTPDNAGSGSSAYYVEAGYSMPLGSASLDLHAGTGTSYTTTSGGAAYDASIGVSGTYGGLDLAAVYSTTSADPASITGSQGQFAVSASKSF